jgi:ankyrin repeat protein
MSSLNTQLFKAVSEGDIGRCKYLLDHGADVNARKNTMKTTPLHIASVYGFIDICKLLLEYGADINIKNIHNETPLKLATYYRHKDIVELFAESEMFTRVFTRRRDLVKLMMAMDINN